MRNFQTSDDSGDDNTMFLANQYVGLVGSTIARALIAMTVGCFLIAPIGLPGSQLPAQSLTITIIEGDGALNNIKLRTNREIIVQVEDQNHQPIAGAAVSAFLPNDGASGTFVGGGQMFNGTSAGNGRVIIRFKPNNVQGKYQVRLSASSQGQSAATVAAQTNVLSAATAGVGLSLAAKILIIVAVGAGAGAGIAVAQKGGTPPPSSGSTPSAITIGPGISGVTIGPPH